MIEVRNLVKQYGDHLAVDHLSFTVKKGQSMVFSDLMVLENLQP